MSTEQADFDRNTAELLEHVLEKGFQLGSCLGSALFAPLSVYKGRHSGTSLSPRLLRVLSKSALVGTGVAGELCLQSGGYAETKNSTATQYATGLLGVGRVYGTPLTPDGVEDRVCRLRHNLGQNRTDKFSRIGLVAGAAISAAQYGITGSSLLGGAAFGTSIGILAHVATYQGAEKGLKTGPANMVEELKHSD